MPPPASAPLTGLSPRRLLVRGVNWLGDAILSTPALVRLRERFPDAHLALLTPAKLADLWPAHPAVDAILPFSPGESPWQIARRLRPHAFDLGLLFPNSPRSALELWFARLPLRIGYRRPWRRWFLTHPLPPRPGEIRMRKRAPAEIARLLASPPTPSPLASSPPRDRASSYPPDAHHLHLYLHLVHALGASPEPLPPLLRLTAAEEHAAPDLLRRVAPVLPTTVPAGWLGLNPGAEYGPAKRWPADRFIAVANEVTRRTRWGWLVLGGPGDQALADAITQAVPGAINLAGRTRLRELLQILHLCRLLLTNDSGPAHVAAALGLPVIALFGSTSPELTAPGLPGDPRHRLLRLPPPCAPCFRRDCPADLRCLRALEPGQVIQAVLETFGQG